MDKKVRVIEDLSRYHDCLTVGRLRKFLENHPELPDDAMVLTQRVKDVYYEKHGWGVILKEGYEYHVNAKNNRDMQEEIERRARGEKPHYDMIDDPSKLIVELDDSMKEQYHPAFCCMKYRDDDNLYIDLHY